MPLVLKACFEDMPFAFKACSENMPAVSGACCERQQIVHGARGGARALRQRDRPAGEHLDGCVDHSRADYVHD